MSDELKACPHENFNAIVNVNRIQKSDQEPDAIIAYNAEIRISCRDCGQPLEFYGLPVGVSPYRPTVSLDGQEMRAPLVLPGTVPPDGLAGFAVAFTPGDPEKEPTKQ
jgi:hypothetical protein